MRRLGLTWALLAVGPLLLSQEQATSAPEVRSSFYRGRPVTYQVIDGMAIYQGDIVLGTAAEMEAAREPAGKAGFRGAMVVSSPSDRWPGGVVPYVIDPGLVNPSRVRQAVAHWNSKTPIRFVERTSEPNWVVFTPGSGTGVCSSYVGMVGFGEQTITLDRGCGVVETIHEMGHAVGLWHEQSRADRDRHVEVRYQNVDKRYTYNFDQELADGADSGPYDYGSIMHYGAYDFSRNGEPTIETIPPGIPIRIATGLSEGDIDGVRRLYGQPPLATTITTNPPGLQVSVDGETLTAPVSLDWVPGSVHTIGVVSPQGDPFLRYLFGRWSDDGAQTHQVTASPSVTTLTANFIEQYKADFWLFPDAGGAVEITPSSPDGFYTSRSSIQLRAEPSEGYNFFNWAGFLSGAANPLQAHAEDLEFAAAEFTTGPVVTVASDPPGRRVSVDGISYTAPHNFRFEAGSEHTLLAPSPQTSSPARYIFNSWDNGETGELNVKAAGEAAVYTARFTTQHPVTTDVRPSPLSGSVALNPSSADGYYDAGTTVELTATPGNAHVRLDYWSGDLGGFRNPIPLLVDDQKDVTANFVSKSAGSTAVVNAASYASGSIAPGQLVTVFGTNLGPVTPALLRLDGTGKVATELAGARILFDGVAAPMVMASANQSSAVVPYSVAGKSSTRVVVEYKGVQSSPMFLGVSPSAPGIFTLDMSGRGQGAILNEDGVTLNSPANPAARGSVVVLYATGGGQTFPPGEDGAVPVGVLPKPVLPVRVTIGGVSAEVLYAGAAPYYVSGLMQVNVRVPRNIAAGDYVPVVLTVGDRSSFPAVTLCVR
ncbi:MAG: M12 family metallopeptidase [Bryobacteraceae bacterium]